MIETVKELFYSYEINVNEWRNKDDEEVQEFIANGGTVEPEFTDSELLEKAKADKLAEIKADKHAKYAEPVDYFGTLYDGDPASGQIAFNVYAGHVLAKDESIEDVREWGTLENRVSLNYGDLLNISELIEAKTTKAKEDEYVRLTALEAATTIEEVEAI